MKRLILQLDSAFKTFYSCTAMLEMKMEERLIATFKLQKKSTMQMIRNVDDVLHLNNPRQGNFLYRINHN